VDWVPATGRGDHGRTSSELIYSMMQARKGTLVKIAQVENEK
jgi:hypothetical protein